ncbi:hypothetical protein D9613_004103 [Agrocybe pediades]|uniref:Uncharacterized protein n=1 Tax=Agrocybe pediades TaxID=84607 RepID=A0A8H4QJR5_9AGAR|nr:hypothetical protein D9613_004103 [Agrocybe pediades]
MAPRYNNSAPSTPRTPNRQKARPSPFTARITPKSHIQHSPRVRGTPRRGGKRLQNDEDSCWGDVSEATGACVWDVEKTPRTRHNRRARGRETSDSGSTLHEPQAKRVRQLQERIDAMQDDLQRKEAAALEAQRQAEKERDLRWAAEEASRQAQIHNEERLRAWRQERERQKKEAERQQARIAVAQEGRRIQEMLRLQQFAQLEEWDRRLRLEDAALQEQKAAAAAQQRQRLEQHVLHSANSLQVDESMYSIVSDASMYTAASDLSMCTFVPDDATMYSACSEMSTCTIVPERSM